MPEGLTRFEERMLLLLGGVTLIGLSIGKRRPYWGGPALVAVGAFVVPAAVRWLRPESPDSQTERTALDPVLEASLESFPASDSPGWAMSGDKRRNLFRTPQLT